MEFIQNKVKTYDHLLQNKSEDIKKEYRKDKYNVKRGIKRLKRRVKDE